MRNPRSKLLAFTLIELLTVIAIIGILSAITFGVGGAVRERAKIQQARTELATLSTALENYKRQFGDYPRTGDLPLAGVDGTAVPGFSTIALGAITTNQAQGALFNALAGKYGPKRAQISGGKVFIEMAKFKTETPNLPDLSNDTPVDNALLDPWGRRYVYVYRVRNPPANDPWKAPSYVLYSAGPDGEAGVTIAADGSETVGNAAQAADNIYANR